jgi:hypothetical protein
MQPRTLRTIGNVGIVAGIVGLALTVIVVGLVVTGATEPPATIMAVLIPIQSVVNVTVGSSLRRQAGSSVD